MSNSKFVGHARLHVQMHGTGKKAYARYILTKDRKPGVAGYTLPEDTMTLVNDVLTNGADGHRLDPYSFNIIAGDFSNRLKAEGKLDSLNMDMLRQVVKKLGDDVKFYVTVASYGAPKLNIKKASEDTFSPRSSVSNPFKNGA